MSDDFVEGVRERNETALSRLGSSKSLYADTAGEMEPEAVLRAAARAEFHAAETFAEWADDEDNGNARGVWEHIASVEGEHYETVLGELDGEPDVGEAPAVQAYLRSLDDTVERAGALVGRTVAADKSKEQMTGFFTGQADPTTASTFRGLRGDLDDQLERAVDLLEAICEDESDWERAADAADEAIQTAYEAYTESLEEMGVNPKPVC
jgi:rubrerythrin